MVCIGCRWELRGRQWLHQELERHSQRILQVRSPSPAFPKPPLNTGSYTAANGRPDRIRWHRSVQSVTFLQVTDRNYPSQSGVVNFFIGRALRRAGLVWKCRWDPKSARDCSPVVLTTRQRFPWRSSKSSLPTLFVTDAVTSDLLLILHPCTYHSTQGSSFLHVYEVSIGLGDPYKMTN